MLLDAVIDHARHAKGFASGTAIDQRLGARRDAVEEGIDLVGKAVLLLDLVVFAFDGREPHDGGIAAEAIAGNAPLAEVATEIMVASEYAHLPFGLVAHPARGDVGDAARLEVDSGIGKIDPAAEHRRADGVHLAYRRVHEPDDHVDVVNHEIEDHVDLDTAVLPRRDAVALEIERLGDHLGKRAVGAREALDVPDLEHDLALLGEARERIRASHAFGDRLLDEHVDAGLDQVAGNRVMERGRHGDTRCIDLPENAAIVEGRLCAELGSDRARPLFIGVDHGNQLGALVAGIVLGVKAPEITRADYRDADLICHASTASTCTPNLRNYSAADGALAKPT